MKFKFSLQKKEIDVEADVEGLVEKGLAHKEKQPPKKTRYQIKQEEKRKNKEQEMKQAIIYLGLMMVVLVFFLLICFVGSKLS